MSQDKWLEGKSGTLACSSNTHDGSLNFRWQKDGTDIVAVDDAVAIHLINERMSMLVLKRLTAADSGEYTCVASNIAGTASASKQMVVYGTFAFAYLDIFYQLKNTYKN